MSGTALLRQSLETGRTLLVPGVANALAAKIVQDIGFSAVYVSGAGIANSFLGEPDIGLVALPELAQHVWAIRDAVDLPIIVDVDTGFGNAFNVIRTVRTLERAGAAAIQIEDQQSPKRCGHFDGKTLVSQAEMVQKIHAAVDTRNDQNFVLIARTDALASEGLDDALERAGAYLQAGADVAFIEAPRTKEEVVTIRRSLAGPQLVNMVIGGQTPLMSYQELSELGFEIVLYANAALQAAIHGMQLVLGHLHAHGSIEAVDDHITSFAERQRLVGKDKFDALERNYGTVFDQATGRSKTAISREGEGWKP